MTSMGGDPTVQAAMEGTSPDTPQWGRLTPDQIGSMMEQGRGTALDIGAELGPVGPATPSVVPPSAAPAAPPQPTAPTFSPQEYQYWAQQQQQQAALAAAKEQDQRIQRLEYERRLLAEQAQRAQAYEQWFSEHPEVVEQALGKAPASQTPQYEDPMAQEIRQLRREAEMARREGALARHLAEHSIEASLLSKQYGNSVDIEALTAYAQENGIPRLRDALAHAAGQVALQAYSRGVGRQQHAVVPQQAPPSYNYQGYAQAPSQYYGPSMTPGPAAEPPPASNAVVMRPGAPTGQRPRYAGPASTQEEAFSRVARDLGAYGLT